MQTLVKNLQVFKIDYSPKLTGLVFVEKLLPSLEEDIIQMIRYHVVPAVHLILRELFI